MSPRLDRSDHPAFAFAASIAAALLFFPGTASASLSSVYVAETAAGSANGASCADAQGISFLNGGGSWGSGAAQIGPGTTVHLCGTVTKGISAQGSGTAAEPITIVWEKGASVQVCDTNGAVLLSGQSYIVLDLGGNVGAITCPNNGTGLATQIIAVGVGDGFGGTFNHVVIQNGTVGPIYKKTGTGGDGLSTYGIYLDGGTGNRFHDLSFTDSEKGIFFALAGTSTGNEIDHDTFVNIGADIYYACGGANCTDTGGQIHANDFTVGINWGGPGDYTHMESVHVFSNGSGSSISDLLIYDNYTHGAWPAIGGTAAIFVEQASNGPGNGSQSGEVFDNICQMTGGTTGPGDGCIFFQSNDNTFGVYNNVSDCVDPSNSIGKGMELDGEVGNVFIAENNIVLNCNTPVYNINTTGSLTLDHNAYFNSGSSGWWWQGKSYSTLSAWQGASGQDAHSTTSNPGLNTDYTIAASTSAAAGAGSNLTSVGVTALDTGKPTSIGAGSTAVGKLRPSSGAWDLGPYPFGTAVAPDGGASGGDGGGDSGPTSDGGAGPDGGHPVGDSGTPPEEAGSGDAAATDGGRPGGGSPAASSGCGCRAAGRETNPRSWVVGLALSLLVVRRRRRRSV